MTLSGMEKGWLTRVISMRRLILEIWTDCCNSSKLLPSRGLTCSSSSRSIRCHSACHMRRLARRRLTSNEGSSGVAVIIDLSLPVQEAEDTLCVRVRSLVWGWLCGLFWRLHAPRAGRHTVPLCCFFLLCPLSGKRLDVTDQRQICKRLADRLLLPRTGETLCYLPLGQADLAIGSIGLLRLSCSTVAKPYHLS